MHFLVPGDPLARTGGYAYDRRIVAGLRALGHAVQVHALDASFPHPDDAALAAARRVLNALPSDAIVVIDGLALGAMPEVVAAEAARLRLIALVHHPLAAETGLDASRRRALFASEQAALAQVRKVIVTSPPTAAALERYGVARERVEIIEPGTDHPAAGTASVSAPAPAVAAPPVALLCIATVVPRKGHLLLLEALAGLPETSWRLDCIGSLDRDPGHAVAVARRIEQLGISARVVMHGECDEATLDRAWQAAEVFVLPTLYEGYGMAVAEALARGLPIISTRTGGIAAMVGDDAGRIVEPGDAAALGAALGAVIRDPELRANMAGAARLRATALPQWPAAVRAWAAVLAAVGAEA